MSERLDILTEALRLIADPDRVQSLDVARGIARVALMGDTEPEEVAS